MFRCRELLLLILFIAVSQLTTACSKTSSEPGLLPAAGAGLDATNIDQIVGIAAQQANAMYNGLRTNANVDRSVAMDFVHNSHAGIFPKKERLDADAFNENDWIGLSWSQLLNLPFFGAPREFLYKDIVNTTTGCGADSSAGSMVIQSSLTDAAGAVLAERPTLDTLSQNHWVHQHFTVDYNNCISGANFGEYNGRVHVFISRNSVGGAPWDTRRLVYIFENLSVSLNNETFQIDGSSEWPDYSSCLEDGVLTNNLHIQHLGTGTAVLLSNFKHYWPNSSADECDKFRLSTHSYLSGLLHLSDHGSVEFYIPDDIDPLNDAWTNKLDNLYFRSENINVEVLTGEYTEPQSFRYESDLDTHITKITVTNSLTKISESASHANWDFVRGSTLDLGDDDADGMSNSWEVIHGLNPNDPADANIDLDGDGLSNLIEFNAYGHPNLKSAQGIDLDDEILHPFAPNYVNNVQVSILRSFAVRNETESFHDVVVEAHGDGEWVLGGFQKTICTIHAELNQVHCGEDVLVETGGIRRLNLSFRPTGNTVGYYGFTATIHTYDYDFNKENNVIYWEAWNPG